MTKLALVGAAAMIVTLIANAPASVIAPFAGDLTYSDIEGTLWKGNLKGAAIAGVPLGDVAFELAPPSVFTLAPKARLSISGGAVDGEGVVQRSMSGRITVRNLKADIYLNAVAPYGLLGAPTNGVARIDLAEADYAPGKGCTIAGGTLWTNVLNGPARRFDMPALPLSGGLSCDKSALVADLAGANEIAAAQIAVRIEPNLRYVISATAQPAREEIASALRFYGFEGEGKSLSYGASGVFKGAGS